MKRFTLLACLLVVVTLVTSVAAQTGDTYYIKVRSARVRAEATTTASVVANLRNKTAIVVLELVDGAKVSGSTVWYRIDVAGETGYIHSSLVTSTAPVVSGGGNSGGGQTLQSTPPPLVEQVVAPPPPSGASCNGASVCGEMGSCEQAYACLAAGDSGLDRDHDGVPCESICPGG
jgi:hypothetical protein